MIEIGRQALALEVIPIGNPDAVPKRQFQKKKIHGKADARALSGAEIAARELKAREAWQAREDSNSDEDDGVIVLDTPPRATGVSQGRTSITLAIRSPEAPQRPAPYFVSSQRRLPAPLHQQHHRGYKQRKDGVNGRGHIRMRISKQLRTAN
jgi:hypothetical protein